MRRPVTVEDVRRQARRRLPRAVYDFVEGGAEDERTLAWNRDAFARLALLPRVLAGAARRDLGVTVLGDRLALPVVLGPAGLARLVHRDGEVAAARAAGAAGTAFVLSTGASRTIEDVAAAAPGPLWFQLYLWRDRGVVGDLLDRAAAAGCRVLCVTADVPVVGQRERDLRNGLTIPLRLTPRTVVDAARRPRWLAGALGRRPVTFENLRGVAGAAGDSATALARFVNRDLIDPAATWDTLSWVRGRWRGPVVVKGVLGAPDARRAVDCGADGVVVSNHGGRQLDSAAASLDVLPEIADAVGDRAEVLLDGGVRRGTDVAKALALGTRAVLVARPWLYGLAAGGEAGVGAVLDILRAELERTLTLAGRRSVADLDPSAVLRRRG